MRVAPAAVAALAKNDPLAVDNELGDHASGGDVRHDRAERQPQDRVHTLFAVAVLAEAVLAALALPVGLELEVDEVVRVVGT